MACSACLTGNFNGIAHLVILEIRTGQSIREEIILSRIPKRIPDN